MAPALAPVFMFLGMLLSQGRNLVDFTNDILNNVVSITGDAHQARVAQDIFRQEVRYERSLQIREDIRDQRKVMLESVTSYLYFGSIILATCFVTVIEGFPPINSNRMVVDWWLLFAVWAITFELLAMWYALCFQVKLSQSARERLLRRYRYRLADDQVVDRMGGKNLVNTIVDLNQMMATGVSQFFAHQQPEMAVPQEQTDPNELRTRVRSLDQSTKLHVAPLRKQMNAWMHQEGAGYAKPIILDAPYFLMGETLLRQTWNFNGEKPLLLRVKGESTLYLAAQCPPLGGSGKSTATMHGLYKAVGADVPEWPEDELPVITAGFHPAWKGPSGYGELQRVDGVSIFIDENHIEIPVYKIVLDHPDDRGYVDVIVCWQFQTYCEAPVVILRKGHVHCKEEDWPMAEFNEEIRQIMPLQDYSGWYMRRGTVCLIINVCFAVLSRLWLLGERRMWWAESFLMLVVLLPAMVIVYCMPISISSTVQALRMSVINRVDSIGEKGIDAAAKWMEKQLSQGSLNTRQNILSEAKDAQEARSPAHAHTSWHTAPAGLFHSTTFETTNSQDGSYFSDHLEREPGSPRRVPRKSQLGAAQVEAVSRAGDSPPPPPPRAEARGWGCCDSPTRASDRTSIQTQAGEAPPPSALPMCPRLCGGPDVVAKPHRILVTCPEEVTDRLNSQRVSDNSDRRLSTDDDGRNVTLARSLSSHTDRALSICSICVRCIPRRLRSCIAKCWRLWRGQSRHLYHDTQTYKQLSNITTLLDALFLFTVLWVIGSPAVDWFQTPVRLGPTPGVDAGDRRLLDSELQVAPAWTVWPASWPPFLDLTAAALDVRRDTLYVASGSVLWTLRRPQGLLEFAAVGEPRVFPEAVRGLCFLGNSLRAVSDVAVYDVPDDLEASRNTGGQFSSASPMPQPLGLLGLAHMAVNGSRGPVPRMTHSLSPVASATAIEIPGDTALDIDPSAAVIVASRTGDVHFTAAVKGKLKVLARIEHEGTALWNVTGLHASTADARRASEPALWAATGSGDIMGLGLTTGRLLATLPRPSIPDMLRRQRLRGRKGTWEGDATTSILALTGNATHLVAIAKVEGQLPVVLSTPFASLVTGDSALEL